MRSKIDGLSKSEKDELIKRLHQAQNGLCYIDRERINLQVHAVDIDHIRALARGGPDHESNWGLTHAACNRSKGARDLQLQHYIHIFRRHLGEHEQANPSGTGRSFTVGDALDRFYPERQEVGVEQIGERISLASSIDGQPVSEEFTLIYDELSGTKSFVGMLAFEWLFHDVTINPRSIVDLEPMIEEFYKGNPQLQPSLASLDFTEPAGRGRVLLFDGQHKAAAQLYVHNKRLLVRVFLNTEKAKLKETNFRAHTKLAQIHFPQLVNDRVGHDLFHEEYERFLAKAELASDSEAKFIDSFDPAARAEYRGYLGSFLRYEALTSRVRSDENRILEYVETINPRSKRYPLSYDTLQATFLTHFLHTRPTGEALANTQGLRQLERRNLVRVMDVFVEEVLGGGRFNLNEGIFRIEENLRESPDRVGDSHLRAYRLCRKPAMVVWIKEVKRAVVTLLRTRKRYERSTWAEERPLWAEIKDEDWQDVRRMIQLVRDHKVWGEKLNHEVVAAMMSTRQRDWTDILLDGRLPGRAEKLYPELNSDYIFQNALN